MFCALLGRNDPGPKRLWAETTRYRWFRAFQRTRTDIGFYPLTADRSHDHIVQNGGRSK